MKSNYIKTILAIILLLCLFNFPYGYYQFVRFATMLLFSYLAFLAKKLNNNTKMFIYIGLAILFQPFIKIALGRTIWNIVDVVIAVGLLVSVYIDNKTTSQK